MARKEEWDRVARFVLARRGALGLTQDVVAARAGMDVKTLNAIERRPGPRRATTLGGLERALGWTEGSIARVVAGGDPTLVDEPERVRTDPAVERLRSDPDLSDVERDALILMLRTLRGAPPEGQRTGTG